MAEDRSTIIKSVQTPAGLFALVFLIVEGILGVLAARASGRDFTLLVGGKLVLFLSLVVVFGILATKNPDLFRAPAPVPERLAEPEKLQMKFDAFLSAPMAATSSEAEYKNSRDRALTIMSALKREMQFETIYFAGEQIAKKAEFDPPRLAILTDFDNIKAQPKLHSLVSREGCIERISGSRICFGPRQDHGHICASTQRSTVLASELRNPTLS
jgi:hypothetical protein